MSSDKKPATGWLLEGLMTAEEVARVLRCGPSRVHRLRRAGDLPAIYVGKHVFDPEDVRAFIKAGGKKREEAAA